MKKITKIIILSLISILFFVNSVFAVEGDDCRADNAQEACGGGYSNPGPYDGSNCNNECGVCQTCQLVDTCCTGIAPFWGVWVDTYDCVDISGCGTQGPECGDGITDAGEECDNGGSNSNSCPAECSSTCTLNDCCTVDVDGGWSDWGSCNSGTRTRSCNSPPQACNGAGCVGASSESCTSCSQTNGGVEACDNVDNDCDGSVDEGLTTTSGCDPDGACSGAYKSCSSGSWGACSINPGTESCNNVDDDCDGSVDEGLTTTSGCSQSGICSGATTTCSSGSWGTCSIVPAAEVCDGLDNDCDGSVDENPVCSPIGNHDVATCNVIQGWSCDPSSYGSQVTLSIYRENVNGGGQVLLSNSVVTDIVREAGVTTLCGGNGNAHGFSYTVPSNSPLRNGLGPYNISVYAQNVGTYGSTSLLSSSPKTLPGVCCTSNYGAACNLNACGVGGTYSCTGVCSVASPPAVPTEICDNLDNDCDGQFDEGCDVDNDEFCNQSMSFVGTPDTCIYGMGDCQDSIFAINPGRPELCSDSWDNNCNARCDYDTHVCSNGGESTCPVSVTGISVSSSEVCSLGSSLTIGCNSSVSLAGGQYDINSIVATLNGNTCMFDDWSGSVAQFVCLISGSGVQQAKCSVDTSKSYQSGSNQTTSVTVISNEVAYCFDGVDNDCDMLFDGDQFENSDPDCCAQYDSKEAAKHIETSCTDGLDNDCDGSIDCGDSDCGDADDDQAFCATCTGAANTWQFGNDTLPFGGYTTYNTKECCGDDLNEDLSSGINGCCNGPNECIDAIGMCRSGVEDTQGACSNGVDDDCDGRIDLMDLGCYGSIQGTVYDALGDGRILVNANVSISPPGIGGSFSASDLTDSNGDFLIVKAIIGTYNIISRKSGYVDEVITITVNAGQVTTVDFTQSEGLNCHSDCTDNKGLCNSACDGFTDSLGASCSFANPSCNGRAVGSVFRYNTSGTQYETTCCEGPTTNYGVVSSVKPSCPSGLSQVVQSTPVLLNGIRVIQKTVICRRTQ